MARLISLALQTHPRVGPCFVVRFSWNSRAENPVEEVRRLPVEEREYEADNRRWWIATKHAPLLASLFDNWLPELAALASAQPEAFSRAMSGVLRGRILTAVSEVLEAVPTISWEDLLRAVGEAAGWWLEEWRRAAPDTAAAVDARLGDARKAAEEARARFPDWALRAAMARDLLSPQAPAAREAGDE